MIQELLPQAERIAARLKRRGETISVAESSTAGLISAALLAVAGASAYFMGGAVVYTRASRTELLRVTEEEFAALTGITPSTEPYAMLFARKIRERLATTWGAGEPGTAGPPGTRYGHAPGHSCIAVLGPVERAITIETGSPDRVANMRAFTVAALDLLEKNLEWASAPGFCLLPALCASFYEPGSCAFKASSHRRSTAAWSPSLSWISSLIRPQYIWIARLRSRAIR